MTLNAILTEFRSQEYDAKSPLGQHQPIFAVLEKLKSELEIYSPSGYVVDISYGVGKLPFGLWVAVLNEEVTSSAMEGLYLIYLFDEQRRKVSLSLNQGATAARNRAGELGLTRNELLRDEASTLRGLLEEKLANGLEQEIFLGKSSDRLRAYEHGNVLAKTWQLDSLPAEEELVQYFNRFIDLYDHAVHIKESALVNQPGKFSTPARKSPKDTNRKPFVFMPKSSEDYLVQAPSYVDPQRRQRRHEQLVHDFGRYAICRSLGAATSHHPIDLVLKGDFGEIIVEVKIIDVTHPSAAIRESIGQLFEYRTFLRPDTPSTPLLAVYDQHPNGAYVHLLDSLNIGVCWRNGDGFDGTDVLRDFGLLP